MKYPEDAQALAFHRQAAENIAALPGVESVGWTTNLPLSGDFDRYGMPIEERPEVAPQDRPSVERYAVNPGYLDVMRIPLIRGRTFTEQDAADSPLVVLINQVLARRFWPDGNPLGKRIRLGGGPEDWRTIVGVVGDIRHYGLDAEPTMQAYVPQAQAVSWDNEWVVRTSSDPLSLAGAVRQEIWTVDPDRPVYEIMTMDQLTGATLAQRRFTLLLLGLFSLVALLLAAIGLYGVISYSVTQRTQEVGIRMALGAGPRDILALMVGRGMLPALTGVGIGLVGAAGLTRFLSSLLYEVSATDPATFIGVSILLTVVALLACYIPARRATRVDPMVALRYE